MRMSDVDPSPRDHRLEHLIERLPSWARSTTRWLWRPSARLVRIPHGCAALHRWRLRHAARPGLLDVAGRPVLARRGHAAPEASDESDIGLDRAVAATLLCRDTAQLNPVTFTTGDPMGDNAHRPHVALGPSKRRSRNASCRAVISISACGLPGSSALSTDCSETTHALARRCQPGVRITGCSDNGSKPDQISEPGRQGAW